MIQDGLAVMFAKVSEALATDRDESLTVARTCDLAVELVAACDHATVAQRSRRGRLGTLAASSPLGEELDALQVEAEEGPIVLTAGTTEACRSNDVATDARWPVWGAKAAERGARSLVSLPLAADPSRPVGALTLYSHRRGAWEEPAYGAACVFAAHVAQALDAATVLSGLRVALRNRHEIGVAQGILMQRHGLTVAQSFDVLQRFSNTSNTKLSEVAGRIVRELDDA